MGRTNVAGRAYIGTSVPESWRAAVESTIKAAQPGIACFSTPNAAASSATVPAPSSFIQVWNAELGRQFDPEVPRPKDLAAKFDCLITADASDCDAAYALYAKRVPVLLLRREGCDAVVAFAGHQGHPLLTVAPELGTEADVADAVRAFFAFPEAEGRVFVVEGGDGAGKQTQVARIVDRLAKEGYPVQTFDYPHDAARYGLLIREVLGGQRGNMRLVSPLVFAAVYGMNREDHQPILAYWKLRGANVVLDRYMTANFGHQASKYGSDEERLSAINSLATFEQTWLDLPSADRVAYLNLPPEWALRAMQQDTTRKALDEHEKAGIDYKNNVRRAFLWCCANLPGWAEVPCVNEADTERLSRDAVHDMVWARFSDMFVNKQ